MSKIKSACVLPIKKKKADKSRTTHKRNREPEELKEGIKLSGAGGGVAKNANINNNSKTLLNKKKSRRKTIKHN